MAYDIGILSKIDDFSMEIATKNFVSYDLYFDALDNFVEKAPSYLSAYTPSVVVFSQEVREHFLSELEAIQHNLVNLGMLSFASELTDLQNSATNGDVKILEDGLRKFQADMEISAKRIRSARPPDAEDSPPDAKGQKPIVLAVDDSPEILAAVNGILKEQYKVIATTNGGDALKALQSHRPAIFLLDVEMPEMGGLELARAIRGKKEHRKTPILFLTGNSEMETVMAARKIGAKGYILKPVNRSMIDKIASYL